MGLDFSPIAHVDFDRSTILGPWDFKPSTFMTIACFFSRFKTIGFSSWWFFTNPFEKYAQVKLDPFPK